MARRRSPPSVPVPDVGATALIEPAATVAPPGPLPGLENLGPCGLSPGDCDEINATLRDLHDLEQLLSAANLAMVPVGDRLQMVQALRSQLEALKAQFFPNHP